MRTNLRTAMLTAAAGGALAVIGALAGPAGPAGAATVTVELYAKAGSVDLPGPSGAQTVPVWGYCEAAAACTVTAPGGPVLEAVVGDTVNVTLHNTLPEATTLWFGGQALPPDNAGAAADTGTASYSFTPDRPGTYLYEAGVVGGGGAHQVAMGLYGALVVRPATAGQAYDDVATTYDREAVLVLGEIDPVLNNLADPSQFDLRKFSPQWTLINGKAHPDTAEIAAASGQDVLLRWVNAGTNYHSMGVLGADQRLVAVDGSRLANGGTDISRHYVAETFGPGQTADAVVTVPVTAADRRLAVYDASLSLNNARSAGLGGMLTSIAVSGTGTGSDAAGPATKDVAWTGGHLTATVSDAASGGAAVTAAEYYVDSINGTPAPMVATDDTFDSDTEDVGLDATGDSALASALAVGQHVVYVRGQADGGWGPFSSVLVNGSDGEGPTTSSVVLDPERTNGSADVAVTATGDDNASGGSDIDQGELTLDDGGAAITMTTATSGVTASLEGSIPAARLAGLEEGVHLVSVRSQDSAGNWGDPAQATLVVDFTAPAASDVGVTPDTTNGTVPVNGSSPSVRLSATFTDPTPPDRGTGVVSQGAVTAAQARIDGGSTIPMEVADGAWGGAVEGVYLDIPLTTVKTLSDGPHELTVRGRDAAGTWATTWSTTVLTVDRTGPAVGALSLTPNPTIGAPEVTLTGSIGTDPSGVSRVEWFLGSDPGVGNGTLITPNGDGTYLVLIDTTALPEGDRNLTVRAVDGLGNRSTAAVQLQVRRPIWFSLSGNSTPNGVGGAGDDADIFHWSGTAMSRAIDATGIGVPGSANIDGFSRVDATHFYASFTGNVTVGGVQAADEDVVYYNNGAWSLYMDGSANGNGLGGGSTDVDAISVRGGSLYVSLSNGTTPPGVSGSGDDADIYRWNGLGSSPRFTRVVDASAIGLSNNVDVDGFVWVSGSDWAFSFAGNTSIGGVSVNDEDVVRRVGSSWSLYFDGSAYGLTNNNNEDVDAFDIP